MLLPVPFPHQLLRKGVAIGPAFGIEARAGIAVPVPGSADIRSAKACVSGMTYFLRCDTRPEFGGPPAIPSPGQSTASTIINTVAQPPPGTVLVLKTGLSCSRRSMILL